MLEYYIYFLYGTSSFLGGIFAGMLVCFLHHRKSWFQKK